jgi:hypothetical protein
LTGSPNQLRSPAPSMLNAVTRCASAPNANCVGLVRGAPNGRQPASGRSSARGMPMTGRQT